MQQQQSSMIISEAFGIAAAHSIQPAKWQ